MTNVMIAPVEWANLKDIDDVEPLNESDAACFAEVRDVLKRHDRLNRFGLALLHSHFSLAPDEVMVESTFLEDRTLVTKPHKVGDLGQSVGTLWMLGDGDGTTMAYCRKYCERDFFGHWDIHRGR